MFNIFKKNKNKKNNWKKLVLKIQTITILHHSVCCTSI